MAYSLIRSDIVFKGKIFDVRVDEVLDPNGRRMRVDLVVHTPSVALVPMDAEGMIWFVRQYRHPAGEWLLELPAGSVRAGEDLLECARRECREEIGMSPGNLTSLGGSFIAPGYSTEFLHFYLAQDLTPAPLPPDEDEDLQVLRLTKEEALGHLREGSLRDTKSIAGLFLAFAEVP